MTDNLKTAILAYEMHRQGGWKGIPILNYESLVCLQCGGTATIPDL